MPLTCASKHTTHRLNAFLICSWKAWPTSVDSVLTLLSHSLHAYKRPRQCSPQPPHRGGSPCGDRSTPPSATPRRFSTDDPNETARLLSFGVAPPSSDVAGDKERHSSEPNRVRFSAPTSAVVGIARRQVVGARERHREKRVPPRQVLVRRIQDSWSRNHTPDFASSARRHLRVFSGGRPSYLPTTLYNLLPRAYLQAPRWPPRASLQRASPGALQDGGPGWVPRMLARER